MNAILFAIVIARCGVRFTVPKGWHSALAANDNDAVICKIDLTPPHWPSPKPRWGQVAAYPVRVEVFAPSASYDEAVDEMGFEKDEEGRIGFYGRGYFDEAEPFKIGNLSGVQSTPFFRGYIDDEALLRPGELRVYTTSQHHVVAKTPGGRWIGIECDSGTPDDSVDCGAVVSLVAQSLRQEGPVTGHARGTFDVKVSPQPLSYKTDDATLARMSIEKQFHGDLEATSSGEMLSAGSPVKGSAGYVAIERVSGTLAGRTGTFVLQHSATMNSGVPSLSVTVVPDSGSGELVGLTGKMAIIIEGAKHSYEFEYALP